MAEIPLWQSRFLVPAAAVAAFLDALDDELSVSAFEDARAAATSGRSS